jgi:hypothetical protein
MELFPPLPPELSTTRFRLKPSPSGEGYTVSARTLAYILTNETYIGTFRRRTAGGEICIQNNHPPIVSEDLFWNVYDHLSDTRPDGTPTGRMKLVRYSRNPEPEQRRPLLDPVSSNGSVTWHISKRGKEEYCYYKVVEYGLVRHYIISVDADILEGAVCERLFQKIKSLDWEDLQNKKEKIKKDVLRRERFLRRKIESINLSIDSILQSLKNIRNVNVLKEIEDRIQNYINMRAEAERELAQLKENSTETLGTIEEELAVLQELWPLKPLDFRRALLTLLIRRVCLDYLAPHLYSLSIEWNWPSWGTEQALFMRHVGGSKDWSEEEIAILERLYPSASQEEIMQALPRRTWGSIVGEASQRGIKRAGKPAQPYGKWLSFEDFAYLKAHGLREEDFHKHIYQTRVAYHTKWSTLSQGQQPSSAFPIPSACSARA